MTRCLWPVLLVCALCAGCGDKSTTPPDLYEVTGTASGEIPLQGQTTLRCVSSKGMVTVQGEGLGTVRWYVYKTATAPTQDQANEALAQIVPTSSTIGDTLVFDLAAPTASRIYCHGAVTLGIPYQMDCMVEAAVAPVHVSDLFSSLKVRGDDSASVERHTGSCDIAVSKGGLALEVALPDSGFCLARTEDGSIQLRLPATASAKLVARAEDGAVTLTGLTMSGRVDSTGYLSGILGTGTGIVRLETRRGDITVTALSP